MPPELQENIDFFKIEPDGYLKKFPVIIISLQVRPSYYSVGAILIAEIVDRVYRPVIEKIERVRYPQALFAILDKAFEGEQLTLNEVRNVLRPYHQISYAKGYLTFATQSLILDKNYPSCIGRAYHRLAQEDETLALHRLLSSLPYYHLHAELRLATLLLEAITYKPHQKPIILERIQRSIPWYLDWRLPWILINVGWRDSANIQADLGKVMRALEDSRFYNRFVDLLSLRSWDEQLQFIGVSDLTQVDNLCRFIADQNTQHFVIDSEWLSSAELGVLLLLVLGQLENRSLNLDFFSNLKTALYSLECLGLDVRQNHSAACLASPVKIIFKYKPSFDIQYRDVKKTPVLKDVFDTFENNPVWDAPFQTATHYLDLGSMLQTVLAKSPPGLFTYEDLNEDTELRIDSQVEVWRGCTIYCFYLNEGFYELIDDTKFSFPTLLTNACQPGGLEKLYYLIFLTQRRMNDYMQGDFRKALDHIPHLFLLTLILIDHEQSNFRPTLEAGEWLYARRDLISILDDILRSIGFDVWDEWYVNNLPRRHLLAAQLVEILQKYGVAHVSNNYLEITEAFQDKLIVEEFAWLRNQTRQVRPRIRRIVESVHSS